MMRIAQVEDDVAVAELVRYNLLKDGYLVDVHKDGESLLSALDAHPAPPIDLFLLDVMLPGIDGFAVLERIRKNALTSSTPVLMLTARRAESDRVRGLESGADDYLVKPFGITELLARVHALLRRKSAWVSISQEMVPSPPYEVSGARNNVIRGSGDVEIDDARCRAYRNRREVYLTHREYELLLYLVRNRGIAVSRSELLQRVWGHEQDCETRTIDVHVRQLRLKLEDSDPTGPLIETVRGRGYRYRES
jgi:DNA-binding response OmpR family regulator